MITREGALYLLEGAFDDGEPSMVHGTSVESTMEMLRSGRLTSSFYPGSSDHPADRGYMFFVPRKKSFVGHPLHGRIKIDLESGKLEDEAAIYAQNTQGTRFLIDTLGYWPMDVFCEEFEPYGNVTLEELAGKGVNVQLMRGYGLARLYNDIKSRKGVCVGLNQRAFELRIEPGHDFPEREVMIHLPDGLDIGYVQYFYPFGDLEDAGLRAFIDTLPTEH